VFPQLSLGEVIGSEADDAYHSINSRRCDLLLTDGNRIPIAALEYQGSGHDIDGNAEQRDEVKRQALQREGVRYVAIREGHTGRMQQIIRQLLPPGV
jgi:hypothetical protein